MCAAVRWFPPRTLQRTVQRPSDTSAPLSRYAEPVRTQAATPQSVARVGLPAAQTVTLFAPRRRPPGAFAALRQSAGRHQMGKYGRNVPVCCQAPMSSTGNTNHAPFAQLSLGGWIWCAGFKPTLLHRRAGVVPGHLAWTGQGSLRPVLQARGGTCYRQTPAGRPRAADARGGAHRRLG